MVCWILLLSLLSLQFHSSFLNWYSHSTSPCRVPKGTDSTVSGTLVQTPFCWSVSPGSVCNVISDSDENSPNSSNSDEWLLCLKTFLKNSHQCYWETIFKMTYVHCYLTDWGSVEVRRLVTLKVWVEFQRWAAQQPNGPEIGSDKKIIKSAKIFFPKFVFPRLARQSLTSLYVLSLFKISPISSSSYSGQIFWSPVTVLKLFHVQCLRLTG